MTASESNSQVSTRQIPAEARAFGIVLSLAIGPILAMTGCGGGPSMPPAKVEATHGGMLLELPDDHGFVEVAVVPVEGESSTSKKRGKVAAYFLNMEGQAPPSTSPTDVKFTPENGSVLNLTSASGGEPAALFESEPTNLPVGDPPGVLEAQIGGKAISLAIRPR